MCLTLNLHGLSLERESIAMIIKKAPLPNCEGVDKKSLKKVTTAFQSTPQSLLLYECHRKTVCRMTVRIGKELHF